MSQTTKKKHVTKEVLDNYILPEDSQQIVKVSAGRGNNLHEVIDAFGQKFLVSMPTKFRKSVWIKRGDYVIVTPIEEGDKVKAEITNILLKHQIKYIRDEGKWPIAFDDSSGNAMSGDRNGDELFRNTNRVTVAESSDDSDYSDSDEEQSSDSEPENV